MKLSDINLAGRTTFFNKVSVTFGGTFDPYEYDENGKYFDRYLVEDGGPLARLTRANLNLSFSLNKAQHTGTDLTTEQLNYLYIHPEEYVNFDIPYNFSFAYSLSYDKDANKPSNKNQSASIYGDVSLTPKWKIGFTSWYDITHGAFTNFSMNFYRDLHCWEMRLNWIPFGYQESWNFQINVKASILQDLKLNKRKDFFD
jgi:hypothetical protein